MNRRIWDIQRQVGGVVDYHSPDGRLHYSLDTGGCVTSRPPHDVTTDFVGCETYWKNLIDNCPEECMHILATQALRADEWETFQYARGVRP